MNGFRIFRVPFDVLCHGRIVGLTVQIAVGICSASCILLLLSRRLSPLSDVESLFLVLFLQWHTFGLTLAKFGIDQLVFSQVTHDPSTGFCFPRVIWRCCLPVAVVYSLASSFWLGGYTAFVLSVCIVLDCYSVLSSADWNARGRYLAVAACSLINYPIFFGLTGILTCFIEVQREHVMSCFLASSLLRAAYCHKYRDDETRRLVDPLMPVGLLSQQLLNYWLFRGDQLLLMANWSWAAQQPETRDYLLNAKFGELTAYLVTLVGVVVLPLWFLGPDDSWRKKVQRISVIFLCGWILLGITKFFYLRIMHGSALPGCAIPLLIVAACAQPSHLLIYSFLRAHCLRGLLRTLALAACFGAMTTVLMVSSSHSWYPALAWGAAGQTAVFCVIPLLFHWGSPRCLVSTVAPIPQGSRRHRASETKFPEIITRVSVNERVA